MGLFGIHLPITSLPDFNGKKANFTGNGTYKYTNFTHGHSLEIHIQEFSAPKSGPGPKKDSFAPKKASNKDGLSQENREKMMKLNIQHKQNVMAQKMKNLKKNAAEIKEEIKNHTMKNATAMNATAMNATTNVVNSTIASVNATDAPSFLEIELKDIIN